MEAEMPAAAKKENMGSIYLTTENTRSSSVSRQADAIPDDMMGPLNVTPEGIEAALSHMAATDLVRWNQPRWEAIEFLRDILARIRMVPAIQGETPKCNRSSAESCERQS